MVIIPGFSPSLVSPVDLRDDQVQAAQDGRRILQEVSFCQFPEKAQVGKPGRAQFDAIGMFVVF